MSNELVTPAKNNLIFNQVINLGLNKMGAEIQVIRYQKYNYIMNIIKIIIFNYNIIKIRVIYNILGDFTNFYEISINKLQFMCKI